MKKYCGIRIQDQLYGIDVMKIREIVNKKYVTKIPHAQKFIKGLINLRGQIITIISLRNLLHMKDSLSTEHMNIIIRNNGRPFSIVVDEITDIIEIPRNKINLPPPTLADKYLKLVEGVTKIENELLLCLDTEKIITQCLRDIKN